MMWNEVDRLTMNDQQTPNTLYYGDNLPILRTYFPAASVDLHKLRLE